MENFIIKERTDFIWKNMEDTLHRLNTKKISSEDAKACANLLKQANNVLAFQLDAAKFITHPERTGTENALQNVGL
jgi:hypothetical protein